MEEKNMLFLLAIVFHEPLWPDCAHACVCVCVCTAAPPPTCSTYDTCNKELNIPRRATEMKQPLSIIWRQILLRVERLCQEKCGCREKQCAVILGISLPPERPGTARIVMYCQVN